MIFFLSLTAILCTIVLWLLLKRVSVRFDLQDGRCEVWQPFSFRLAVNLKTPRLFELRVLGFKIKKSTGSHVNRKKKRKSSSTDKTSSFSAKRRGAFLLRALSRIKVHAFRANIDTGDPVLNAQLVPFAFFLSGDRAQIAINFNGVLSLYFFLSVVPMQILKEYLFFKLKL